MNKPQYKTDATEAEASFKVNAVGSIMKYQDRINMWEKDHKPGSKPPMIQDPSGTYHWMNREERRLVMKNKNRKAI